MAKVGFTTHSSRDGVVLPMDVCAAYPEKMRGCRLPTMVLGLKTGMADDPDGDIRVLLAPMLKYSR